jgi:hypothetical protein
VEDAVLKDRQEVEDEVIKADETLWLLLCALLPLATKSVQSLTLQEVLLL